MTCTSKVSDFLVKSSEAVFYRHGKFISSRPYVVISVSVAICIVASLGIFRFRMESRPERLWIPQDSEFVRTLDWQRTNYPENIRNAKVLFEAENILTPEYIREMFFMKEKIQLLTVRDSSGRNRSYSDMCFGVPALGKSQNSALLSITENLFNKDEDYHHWTQVIPRSVYCQAFDLIPRTCLYMGILEMWPSNSSVIVNLTQEDIIQSINTVNKSSTFSYPINFTSFLGGISRNKTGHVIGAKSTIHIWGMEINREEIATDQGKGAFIAAGMRVDVDDSLNKWERIFIDSVLKWKKILPEGIDVWPQAIRSFADVTEQTIIGDLRFVSSGTFLLSAYVFLVLGKFNMVEARPILSTLGIASVFLSTGFAYGICGFLGVMYGPVHSSLILLLIGLGVDDMFVIVQSLQVVHRSGQAATTKTFEEKMGIVLSNSGVAITVTSLTDFLAFGIGASTGLPALQSFCIYAAVAILSLYIMQITFFFAILTLDQKRLEANRNGFLWCIKHKPPMRNTLSKPSYSQVFLEKIYAPALLKPLPKVLVLVVTAVLTGFSIWGAKDLQREFTIKRFFPPSSYLFNYITKVEEYFPEAGNTGTVYIDGIDLPRELPKLQWLTQTMEENKWISSLDSWYAPLAKYTLATSGVDLEDEEEEISSEYFSELLIQFLFSPKGTKFQTYFYFNKTLSCSDEGIHILASKFRYSHHILHESKQQIEAMEEVKYLVRRANFSGFSTCTTFAYNEWETNKVIVEELIRNLSLALLAIFIMSLLLIIDLRASLLVLLCVALTLIDVMALMYWWGLTIDILTCIHLVLCVGFSVDYSSHVALHFMKVQGTRNERTYKILTEIGSPVFNGAFSTFLSFVLLSLSDSYVFLSFFKIFFGVFIYGIFHGLVFLPVVLSLIGPPSYKEKINKPETVAEKGEGGLQSNTYTFSLRN